MSTAMIFFTFLNSWWVCLLMALPFGREEGKKDAVAYNGSPATFNWKKSVLIATALAAMVTVGLLLIVDSGYFHMDTLS